ncbi:MAG: hypothetical protein IPJ39_06330 [Saprospiraceae bacterium]|nr:hypothetical protein [Saprospiraceae bacterium]
MYFKLTFFFIFLGIVTTIGQSTIGKVNNSQFDDKMAADVAGKMVTMIWIKVMAKDLML